LQKAEKKLLADKEAFYHALGRAEPVAIRALAGKIAYDVERAALNAGLTAEDAEELVNDAVVITISNIQKQAFLFSDFSPVAYANGVVKKLIANRLRTKKPARQELDGVVAISDLDAEKYLDHKELELVIGDLLGKLEENCRLLLRLKYFDNLRDKDIVEKGLAPYNSAATLKSKRSQCLNKLISLAKGSRILKDFFDKI
jgi:DNA-directed RNA polymerase specialized sigma24 family protein